MTRTGSIENFGTRFVGKLGFKTAAPGIVQCARSAMTGENGTVDTATSVPMVSVTLVNVVVDIPMGTI